MSDSFPVLMVNLCGQLYAIAIEDVVEVAAMVETARLMSEGSPALHGVVIRRGQPLMLIDLRHVFYCPDAPVDLSTLFVVVKHHKELVGFLVDHIEGVVYLKQDNLRAIRGGSGYVRGVVTHNNTLVQWLDVAAISATVLPDDVGM